MVMIEERQLVRGHIAALSISIRSSLILRPWGSAPDLGLGNLGTGLVSSMSGTPQYGRGILCLV